MKAIENFTQLGCSCSESIIKEAVDNGILPQEMLSVATSFSGGMGSGCLCGAIAGSQMVIGYLFGKGNPNGNPEIARQKAREFIEEFKKNHKATCCRVLTAGMDMASPERKAHCANMVNECSEILKKVTENSLV